MPFLPGSLIHVPNRTQDDWDAEAKRRRRRMLDNLANLGSRLARLKKETGDWRETARKEAREQYPDRASNTGAAFGRDKHLHWVENAREVLRHPRWADEILPLRHSGWFTFPDGDPPEVYRGVVFQLVAKHGKTRFISGYQAGEEFRRPRAFHNSCCVESAAVLDFSSITDDEREAARYADRLAEIEAEKERDYREAWQAGARVQDQRREIKQRRAEALHTAAEFRQAKRHAKAQGKDESTYARLCALYRADIADAWAAICEARRSIEELTQRYQRGDGFEDGLADN